ncbi:MAG: zf-HC2 domain-containing protein [Candidatus Riflebacteria bacterium]|nr:zf-HC2 domain-containing protein [Candidatus Riflebacteria bacterium]
MACTPVQNLIVPYLQGHLTGPEQDLVLEHVKTCKGCARDLANSRYLMQLLGENLDLPEAPRNLSRAVIETLERGSGRG